MPDPVGPVTRTRPRGLSHSDSDRRRQTELPEAEDLVGDPPEGAGHRAALHEDVGAEPRQTLDAERDVELEVLLETVLLGVGQDGVGQLLGVDRRQRRV